MIALNDFRLGNHVCDIYLHIKKVKIWNGLWHTKIGWNAYFMAHESFLSSSSFSLFSFRFLYFFPSFYLTTFWGKYHDVIYSSTANNDLESSAVIKYVAILYIMSMCLNHKQLQPLEIYVKISCGSYFASKWWFIDRLYHVMNEL